MGRFMPFPGQIGLFPPSPSPGAPTPGRFTFPERTQAFAGLAVKDEVASIASVIEIIVVLLNLVIVPPGNLQDAQSASGVILRHPS